MNLVFISSSLVRRRAALLLPLAAAALTWAGDASGAESYAVFRDQAPSRGELRYSTTARPGWRPLRPSPAAPPRRQAGAPASDPMLVPPQVQRARDRDRYQILSDELQHEKQALALATTRGAAPATLSRHRADIEALMRELQRTKLSIAG